jgi:hypothetical protein
MATQQDNGQEQLSLFGDEFIPPVIEKKRKHGNAAAVITDGAEQPKKAPVSARSMKDQNIEVEPDFTVHYATHSFLVTDFISEIPESGNVSLKQLREKMELQFFELTEQRTVWDYDLDNKRLMPYASGTTKG